jgi:hypothetical protein
LGEATLNLKGGFETTSSCFHKSFAGIGRGQNHPAIPARPPIQARTGAYISQNVGYKAFKAFQDPELIHGYVMVEAPEQTTASQSKQI